MRRRAAALALVVLLALPAAALARRHRLRRPPPVPTLPTALAVNEHEWDIQLTHAVVAAGPVRLNLANRGEDDHDVSIVDAAGVLHQTLLPPGQEASVVVTLAPGSYRLYCSLQDGLHDFYGMHATLLVR